jgi:hypothetical protein
MNRDAILYASAIEHHARPWWRHLSTDDWVGIYAALILLAFLGIIFLGYVKIDEPVSSCYTSTPARR